ncbi:hypothetical protein AKJ16_DCAP02276, partial [Drosera capensis]
MHVKSEILVMKAKGSTRLKASIEEIWAGIVKLPLSRMSRVSSASSQHLRFVSIAFLCLLTSCSFKIAELK